MSVMRDLKGTNGSGCHHRLLKGQIESSATIAEVLRAPRALSLRLKYCRSKNRGHEVNGNNVGNTAFRNCSCERRV